MDFNDYVKGAETTAQFPRTKGTTDFVGLDACVLSSLLADADEIGSIAGRYKKAIRGDKPIAEVEGELSNYCDWDTVERCEEGTVDLGILYTLLGLFNESAEVLGKLIPTIGGTSRPTKSLDEVKDELKAELGDVLWYWAMACKELGVDPNEVAQGNLDKLASRKERGVIKGDGDHR